MIAWLPIGVQRHSRKSILEPPIAYWCWKDSRTPNIGRNREQRSDRPLFSSVRPSVPRILLLPQTVPAGDGTFQTRALVQDTWSIPVKQSASRWTLRQRKKGCLIQIFGLSPYCWHLVNKGCWLTKLRTSPITLLFFQLSVNVNNKQWYSTKTQLQKQVPKA